MSDYKVFLTQSAQEDLQDIYDYVALRDAPLKAEQLLDRLEALIESLNRLPERAPVTKELREIGIRDYREVYFKPYRVIFRVTVDKVVVHLIVDGRRDMQTVLQQRLLRT
jgi:toxin ParE1/3/4